MLDAKKIIYTLLLNYACLQEDCLKHFAAVLKVLHPLTTGNDGNQLKCCTSRHVSVLFLATFAPDLEMNAQTWRLSINDCSWQPTGLDWYAVNMQSKIIRSGCMPFHIINKNNEFMFSNRFIISRMELEMLDGEEATIRVHLLWSYLICKYWHADKRKWIYIQIISCHSKGLGTCA